MISNLHVLLPKNVLKNSINFVKVL